MDRARFDALTRLFATTPSRRAALGALLGAGVTSLTGALGTSTAPKKKGKGKGTGKRKGRKKSRVAGQVSTEAADCLSIGPSSNMSGCNFNNEDLAGMDLSSSRMVGTRFRGANLCRADLSSSNLKNADFRGFAAPGNATNLTLADLSSSGCAGVLTNARTIFCQTKTCNGAIRNDDCPGVPAAEVCCDAGDCPANHLCEAGRCRPCDVCLPAGACDFASIQEAVTETDAEGTIRICPGTYSAIGVEIGKSLTLIGAGPGADPTRDTILESNRFQRVFVIVGGSVVIRALRITKGHSDRNGGGIHNAADLTLENVTVFDNFADDHGGGIENIGTLRLRAGTLVTENRVSFDGGGLLNGGGTATLETGSGVTRNTAGDRGGGVFEEGGQVIVADATIVTDNTVDGVENNCRPEGAVPNCDG